MRTVFAALTIAGLAFSGSAKAASPWYVSGSVGGYFPNDISRSDTFYPLNNPSLTANGSVRASFDSNIIGNAALGYRLTPNFRLEAELGYTSYENNALYPFANSSNFPNLNGQKFSRTSGGDVSRFTGTLNGFYDFTNLSSLFAPYIGAGVGGAADRRSSGLYTAANGTVFTSAASSSPQGIGLLEGGLAIKLTGNLSIVPAYRYIQYFRSNQGSANIVKIGLRYQF